MSAIGPRWQWATLLALSLSLAWLLDWASFPAAFMLGPLIAAIGIAIGGARLQLPRWGFTGAQSIIGCLVARAITTSILLSIAQDWVTMLLVVGTTVLAGAMVGWVLVRVGALPGTTAAWGSSPGGASAMIVMAQEFGADIRLVAFMQYLRVIIVVLTASLVSRWLAGPEAMVPVAAAMPLAVTPLLPFLETLAIAAVGAVVASRLRIPAGAMLVPMLIGAVLHTVGIVEITLPPWLLAISYAAVGWYVGLGFTRDVIRYALRALPQLLLATLLLIGLCGLSAWMLTWLLHINPLTAYLATSPGGVDSIAIIAIGSHADIPFVLAIQTLRVFVVIVTGPQIAKLICRYA